MHTIYCMKQIGELCMANNGSCDACSTNARNQMDMRRQKMSMYDRYNRSQMMSGNQNACTSCGNSRVATGYDTVGMGNNCEECGNSNRDKLRGLAVAMGYVPWQNFECTYDTMEGFRAGTIFPELDKPFYGRKGIR